MKRKIIAAVLSVTVIMALFSCCQSPPEPATQLSDKDSLHIKNEFDALEGKLSEAENATAAKDTDSFSEQLKNSDAKIISYEGAEDILIDSESISDKTVTVSTAGSVTLASPVNSLIVKAAERGFTSKARAENIILEGSNITAEIKSETGTVFIKGKDITLNVRTSAIEKIIAVNVSAKVNNLTDDDSFVTLANGAKITVPAKHIYSLADNTIQKS